MKKIFLHLTCLEGDAWVRADQVIGFYKQATRTEVHLLNGEIALTDLSPARVMELLRKAWDH